MHNIVFFGDQDLSAILVETFVAFFFALVLYLRREDRREGYPVEDDFSGRLEPTGSLFFAARPKNFTFSGGQLPVSKPGGVRDGPVVNARRTSRSAGSPSEPIGNPLLAGVGPGSFVERAHRPDRTFHGDNKIAPLRTLLGFSIDGAASDPRGMSVVGADGVAAGVVRDVWIDRAEFMVRYLEVEVAGLGAAAPRRVLVPKTMADVIKSRRLVQVDAVLGSQFADAPVLANADEITFYEEERVCAYFGAGYLYAKQSRLEPFL